MPLPPETIDELNATIDALRANLDEKPYLRQTDSLLADACRRISYLLRERDVLLEACKAAVELIENPPLSPDTDCQPAYGMLRGAIHAAEKPEDDWEPDCESELNAGNATHHIPKSPRGPR